MNGSVFVTGGAGLLGVTWAAAMRDRCKVTLGLHDRAIALRGVETRRSDLESVDALARTLDAVKAELVVHTAGMTNVDACEAEPECARHINVELAANVAAACRRLGIGLVHISTDHLFSQTGDPLREEDALSPVNVYGRTKAEAELRVLDAYADALVVRTNFYGWGPSYRQSFSDTIIKSLRRGDRPTLFTDVHYTPILMDALIAGVHGLVEKKARGVFHVTGDDALTKHEFGVRVAECFGLPAGLVQRATLADKPSLAKRPRSMMLSNAKASALLGRRIGGVREHLATLRQQEQSETVKEIQSL
ncbi:MAG: SDR family oxidoreductase [Gemmatimonadetes bacterium]|nr:SDR family oxidoreductase [Gemmatimonadota bacterium]